MGIWDIYILCLQHLLIEWPSIGIITFNWLQGLNTKKRQNMIHSRHILTPAILSNSWSHPHVPHKNLAGFTSWFKIVEHPSTINWIHRPGLRRLHSGHQTPGCRIETSNGNSQRKVRRNNGGWISRNGDMTNHDGLWPWPPNIFSRLYFRVPLFSLQKNISLAEVLLWKLQDLRCSIPKWAMRTRAGRSMISERTGS